MIRECSDFVVYGFISWVANGMFNNETLLNTRYNFLMKHNSNTLAMLRGSNYAKVEGN